jgi:hypothetical protein
MQNVKTELVMETLHIRRRHSYEENAGKYTAEIHYVSESSNHTLTLDEVISERILLFIGPVICEAAAMVAEQTKQHITRSIEALNNLKAIEAGDLVNAGVSKTAPPQESPDPVTTPEPGDVF